MSLFKKCLLIIFIILFIFILYLLLQKRSQILYNINLKNNLLEGMDPNDPEYTNCYNSVLSKSKSLDPIQYPVGINGNLNQGFQQLPLNQMCIKGAANSAYTGYYITDIMVNYVLSRGCRFLDFEVYYLPDKNKSLLPCVGYSEDPLDEKPSIYNSSNVSLIDMIKASIDYAFNGGSLYKIVNTGDPLFIYLRLKTSNDNMEPLLIAIQNILKDIRKNPSYTHFFYPTKVSEHTILHTIMNKVIIVIENNPIIAPLFKNNHHFYNMLCDPGELNKSFYSTLNVEKYKGCSPKIDPNNNVFFECEHHLNLICPDNNKTAQTNPNIFSSIFNYGNQITLMQYYVLDQELIENEKLFKTYNASFVPMAYCLNFINNYAVPEDLIKSGFFAAAPSI